LNRQVRFVVGLALLVLLLVVAGWFDSMVVVAAKHEEAHTFNADPVLLARAIGFLLVAGAILVLAVAGWRLRSIELGVAYVLVGAFFTFLDSIVWKLAAQVNDAPPVLPEPFVQAVNLLYPWEQGPLGASLTLGAGTLLVGLSLIGAHLVRARRSEP
jgi:hypothetical protein